MCILDKQSMNKPEVFRVYNADSSEPASYNLNTKIPALLGVKNCMSPMATVAAEAVVVLVISVAWILFETMF